MISVPTETGYWIFVSQTTLSLQVNDYFIEIRMSDDQENPRELDLNKFFEAPDCSDYFAYDPKLTSLPFEQVPWPSFEKLSARLLDATYSSRMLQVFGYGRQGQEQFGVDIIALKVGSKKQTVMQCKNVRNLRKGELRSWVRKFIEDKKVVDTEHYILCIPFAVEKDTKLLEEWTEQVFLLDSKGVTAELWSLNKLNTLLSNQPELVEVFFGAQISSRFCSTTLVPDKYPERYRCEFESQFENNFIFENETLRLDVFVPNERSPRFTSILSFARVDLSGITFSIPSLTMIKWLQWVGHTRDLSQAPYAKPLPGFNGRYIFVAPDIRLFLDESEVRHLHWVFSRAWRAYLEAAKSLEANWRFIRFDPIQETQKKTFALAKISRPLWRAFLSFAQEHDSGQGNTKWHIFERSTGSLKVFVDVDTESLDRGYHLILDAYQQGGITLPYDEKVDLGWSAITSISNEPVAMHPRHAWDAEYAHNWLFNEFLPAVHEWIIREEVQKAKDGANFFTKLVMRPAPSVDLSPHIYSLQGFPARSMSNSNPTLESLTKNAEQLQSHFHVYRRDAALNTSDVLPVLRLLKRLANMVNENSDRHIRGNLQLGDGSLSEELEKRIESSQESSYSSKLLDMALRSLLALIWNIERLPEPEMVVISETLNPLWDRMIEDRLCDTLY
ncbi:hypothetical protein [Undibacterium baiyunense]|uniref:Restriction endonuclease n=1 Tax=Undibacterium baiyunense TaxID=2828731 RepID=A0A941DAK6_9BURK|nr:hypothetical protein [Undibacterium baiyunense]MBR7745139.1 hypothetical protein [Undibacterium baiyunense]